MIIDFLVSQALISTGDRDKEEEARLYGQRLKAGVRALTSVRSLKSAYFCVITLSFDEEQICCCLRRPANCFCCSCLCPTPYASGRSCLLYALSLVPGTRTAADLYWT